MPYHSHTQMMSQLENWAGNHPDICKLTIIGKSAGGYDIPCMKVGKTIPRVLMECGAHGDEWIGNEMGMLYLEYLIEQDWRGNEYWVIPMMNPGGHERRTRKNANGVDCNRNFPFHWGECGSSSNPNSPIYRGPSPGSELETRAILDLIGSYPFDYAVSYHSGTEVLAYPWSYTSAAPKDKNWYKATGNTVNNEIARRGFNPYRFGQINISYGEVVEYPTLALLEEDIKELLPKGTRILRFEGNILIIYCCSGDSLDEYYNKDTLGYVLEVSYTKTPPESQIEHYFNRQKALPDFFQVEVPLPPIAGFEGSPRSGAIPLTVNFTDTSTGEISGWLWEFGDGETSDSQNPTHIYSLPNHYDVKLTVIGPGGSDVQTKTDYIHTTEVPEEVWSPLHWAIDTVEETRAPVFIEPLDKFISDTAVKVKEAVPEMRVSGTPPPKPPKWP